MESKEPLHCYNERQFHPDTVRVGYIAFALGMIGLVIVILYSDICIMILLMILVGMVGYSLRNPLVGIFEIYEDVLIYDNTKRKIYIPIESVKEIKEFKTRNFYIVKITHDGKTIQLNYVEEDGYNKMRDSLKHVIGDRWETIAANVE